MSNPTDNKKIVRGFYDLTFNKRKPADAAAKYMGKSSSNTIP